MTEAIELPDTEESSADRFSRTIAILAVLATLAAAAVGYLQSQAGKVADRADADAQQFAVRASGDLARSRDEAQVQFELFAQAQTQRRRASVASDEMIFGSGAGADERRLKLEEERALALADTTEQTGREIEEQGGPPPITPDSADGPQRDGLFPQRFFSKSREEGIRLTGLRDAANEESSERGSQVASYVVILAMLAVAVYLFGFSLTPHGRDSRKLFAGVAGALGAIAVVWAIGVTVGAPERAPDEAAEAFAEGETALSLADEEAAIKAYTKAIDLRPTFARAHIGRSTAEFLAGSPQSALAPSLTSTEARERSSADLEKARELGSRDFSLLLSLGFQKMVLGFEEDDDGKVQEGIKLSEEAEDAEERNPIPTFNKALAQLALGSMDDAKETYGRALEKVVFTNVEKKEKRGDVLVEEGFVAGALSDMELVLRSKKEREKDVAAMKEFVVAYVQNGAPPKPSEPKRLEGVELSVQPSYAQFEIPKGQIDTEKDKVSVQWYRREGKLGWAAIEQVSGPVDPLFYQDTGETLFIRTNFLAATAPPTCLTSADYRLEIYVNGRLGARQEMKADLGELQGTSDTDIGYALCRPKEWKPSEQALPGLITGFVSEDGSSGAYVLKSGAANAEQGDADPEKRALETAQIAVSGLSFLFPAEPDEFTVDNESSFLNLSGEIVQDVTYPGGQITVGSGIDVDGNVFIGMVYGPTDYFAGSEPFSVFNSISQK